MADLHRQSPRGLALRVFLFRRALQKPRARGDRQCRVHRCVAVVLGSRYTGTQGANRARHRGRFNYRSHGHRTAPRLSPQPQRESRCTRLAVGRNADLGAGLARRVSCSSRHLGTLRVGLVRLAGRAAAFANAGSRAQSAPHRPRRDTGRGRWRQFKGCPARLVFPGPEVAAAFADGSHGHGREPIPRGVL